MTRRICFALDLVDRAALIEEYERAHAPGAVWPEIIKAIRAAGYEAMEIWRTGDRLFMIAEVTEEWPKAFPPELKDFDNRWEREMDRFQRRLPHAAKGEKWVRMERMFDLGEP